MDQPQVSLVTGGNGFLGRHLVQSLQSRGHQVRVLDMAPDCDLPGVDYRRVDVTDLDAVRAACEGVDTIVHNASIVHTKWNQEDTIWRVNLGGTENVLRAAEDQGVPKMIYVSSGSVVYEGKHIENGTEELPYARTSQAPYADSKIAAEKCTLGQNSRKLATCALRPHVIFGPGDTRFMPQLLKAASSGRLRVQVGRGEWLSDYTYVSNMGDATVLATEKLAPDSPVAGQAYFITNGEPMPFWEFIRRVIARLELPPIRFAVPHQLVYAIAAVKEWIDTQRGGTLNNEDGLSRFAVRYMCTHHYFSIDKARRELGYDPSVSVDAGIELTARHLEQTGALTP